MEFAKLPLEHVTVITSETYYFNNSFIQFKDLDSNHRRPLINVRNHSCLTAEEKRNLADDIRKLLQPNAARSSPSSARVRARNNAPVAAATSEPANDRELFSDALFEEMELAFSHEGPADEDMADLTDDSE
jgi:hypothetical protein